MGNMSPWRDTKTKPGQMIKKTSSTKKLIKIVNPTLVAEDDLI